MTDKTPSTLIKLSDTDYSVAPTDDDIRDRRVVDTDGDEVGTVHDLLIDRQDQKVRLLRVDHGGILGFGVTSTFVPVEAITEITDDEVRISHSGRHVAETPRYDPDLVDDEYYRQVYAYYGYSDTGFPVVATRGMGLY